jgi:hypothetical protein
MNPFQQNDEFILPKKRICELCGKKAGRMAFIPFNQGTIVCFACSDEWEEWQKNKAEEKSDEHHQTGKPCASR